MAKLLTIEEVAKAAYKLNDEEEIRVALIEATQRLAHAIAKVLDVTCGNVINLWSEDDLGPTVAFYPKSEGQPVPPLLDFYDDEGDWEVKEPYTPSMKVKLSNFEDWFLQELNNTTFKFEEEGVFGYQGNTIVLRYFPNSKNLYILYSKWEEVDKMFELEYNQVKDLIKEQVQKHCKVEECKPYCDGGILPITVQKHCKVEERTQR